MTANGRGQRRRSPRGSPRRSAPSALEDMTATRASAKPARPSSTRSPARWPGMPEPCAQILLEDAGRRRGAGPVAGLRHQPPHQRARCGTDQRHGLARARLRRFLGRARRAPLGARDGAMFALGEQLRRNGQTGRSRPTSSASRPRCGWRAPSISITTTRAGTRPPRSACSARRRPRPGSSKLDVARTAKALALAASFACGLKANFGTMTKPLHIGQAARNGLFAALLAERGFESNPGVSSTSRAGSRSSTARAPTDPERMFERWGCALGDRDGRERASSSSPAAAPPIRPSPWRWSCVREEERRGRCHGRHRDPGPPPPPAAHQQPRTPDAAAGQVLDPVLHRPRAGRRGRAHPRFRGRGGDGGAGATPAAADHDGPASRHARRQPEAVRRRGHRDHEGRPPAGAAHRPSGLPRRRQSDDRPRSCSRSSRTAPAEPWPTTRSRPCSSVSKHSTRSPTSAS